ncbi:unnamed protein product [Cochlearia groenlandica]
MATEKVNNDDGSPPKTKPGSIFQLGVFLIAHSTLFSVVFPFSGVTALLLLPLLAKNTYVSENALMPGSARSMLSHWDVSDGSKHVKEIQSFRLNHEGHGGVYVPFVCSPRIIKAPRGDGKESNVLVTPYDSINGGDYEALSLGIASSLFSLLARVTWLSKDIIWLVADSRYGDYRPVAAWLSEYHTPSFEVCDLRKCDQLNTSDSFRRAGTMAAALVLNVEGRSERYEDTVSIYAKASNGQMPNLDFINVVNYLAWLEKWLVRLNPDWNFGIPVADYLEGSATLASSLYSQALGIPTGPHGAFRDYQVDAITLKVSPRFTPDIKARQHDFFLRGAQLLEGTIRSVNNLLEKFHQSFFLYLLTSPSKFISVGVYMIAFALLVAPLPVVATSLYIDGCNSLTKATHNRAKSLESWKWLDAAKHAPIFSNKPLRPSSLPLILITFVTIPGCSPCSLWLHGTNWTVLKSVNISAAFVSLCLMSIINFATAEIGALLLVPMCLMVRPVKPALRSRRVKSVLGALCSILLVIIGFPIMFFAICKVLLGEGVVGLSLGGEFWTWLESMWAWKSATYLYSIHRYGSSSLLAP